jgi:hypothetical protein
VPESLDRTDVEDRPGPELHRRGQRELEPRVDEDLGQERGDRHLREPDDQRDRQHGRHEQASAEVLRMLGGRLVALRLGLGGLGHVELVVGI